jgi:spore germination protein YaaH
LWKEEIIDGEVKVSSKAYSMDYAKSIMDDNNVEMEWLEDIGQYYGEYVEDDITYKLWLEDVRSMEERMKIAAAYDVGGMAAWKIGLENEGVWDVISNYMKP